MRLGQTDGGRATHLSYCTNIHAGDGWQAAFSALREHVPAVRAAMRTPSESGFGLGLRLSHTSLVELEAPGALDAFRDWLDEAGCYLFTINGFPYGPFHGQTVKADVYRPDWTEPERLDYTKRLATLAASLGAPEETITISTLPGTFKAWGDGAEPAITAQLLEMVAHCVALQRDTGVEIGIALEPEPCCLLETADEVCDFFARCLHTDVATARVADLSSLSSRAAAAAIRRHLGVCHDVCHSAVEFEAPLAAIERYRDAGIGVMKLQLSSALRLDPADLAARTALAAFDEPVYLHQVVRRTIDGTLIRHADIGDALSAGGRLDEEWRVHFHVPVFLDAMAGFGTTQHVLAELLDAQRDATFAPHLEVETYTWDVLPERYRNVSISEAIARELDWVHARLCGAVGETAQGQSALDSAQAQA